MNVQELIEKLGTFDPSLQVIVDGYEGGYDPVEDGSVGRIAICPMPEHRVFHEGKFEDFVPGREGELPALLISRYPHES